MDRPGDIPKDMNEEEMTEETRKAEIGVRGVQGSPDADIWKLKKHAKKIHQKTSSTE